MGGVSPPYSLCYEIMPKKFLFVFLILLVVFLTLADAFNSVASACDGPSRYGYSTIDNIVSITNFQLSFVANKKVNYSFDYTHKSFSCFYFDIYDDATGDFLNSIYGDACNGSGHRSGSFVLSDGNGTSKDGDSLTIFFSNHNKPVYFASFCAQVPSGFYENNLFFPSVSGQLNSFDCQQNNAVFAISANAPISSLYVASVDNGNGSGISSQSFDQSTWNLTVGFANKLADGNHTLQIYGVLTKNGKDYSFTSDINFSTNCGTVKPTPPPNQGEFKIITPAEGQKYDNGVGNVSVLVEYGGNINVDYPNYGVKLKLLNIGGTEWSAWLPSGSFDSSSGITSWTVSMPVSDNNSYTLNAYLQSSNTPIFSKVVASDYVDFTVGSPTTTLSPVQFLKRWWKEFKKWFFTALMRLFVPTNTQFEDLKNRIMSLNIQHYIPIFTLSQSEQCLVLYDGKLFNNKPMQVCLDALPDSVWHYIKVSIDLSIVILALYAVVSMLSK